MNPISLTNLMVTSYRNRNPLNVILQVLLDTETLMPHSSFNIQAGDVQHFMRHVVPEPTDPSSPEAVDLRSLNAINGHHHPVDYCVHFCYFATQYVHLFGKFQGGQLHMEVKRPIICFSEPNVPCSYIWLDVMVSNEKGPVLQLVKHNMPEAEQLHPVRLSLLVDGTDTRWLSVDLSTSCCSPSVRKGTVQLKLDTEAGTVKRTMRGTDGVLDLRGVSYVMVLSYNYVFCQCILVRLNGKTHEQMAVIHPV